MSASQATSKSFPVVGIGASAGGLEAFTELLKHLPTDTGLGFVLVQHLDPQHESALTHLLGRATSMPVREVTNNLRVEPNHVYIIPPNASLSIARGVLKLQPRQQSRRPTRSIDSFFESLAQDQRERAIGVILSGTASDGTLGLEAIKAEGGITFAQDDSARYDSMPRSAVAAGCVDFVLSPADIAQELARIAKHPYVAGHALQSELEREADQHGGAEAPLASGGHGTPRTDSAQARAEAKAAPSNAAENGYKKILLLLRNHCGVDFSLYKSTTIQRRITRRIVLNKQSTLDDYAQFLRGNAKELDALYSDVLISVTSFFRNPEGFEFLKRKVFPKLLQQRGDDPFRVWVLGCSTGQEAYSIAMTFVEASDKAPRLRKLQVFATDLNDALLEKARHGLYTKSLAEDVSPERLRRFFVEEEGGYRIVKSLREMVVFARQNLISDPPFSRMDLISCRNLLIYLEPSLQKKALPTFHYALKPEGFLFLGASESIGGFTDLFEPVDKKHRIYSKKAAPTPAFHLPVKIERGAQPSPGAQPPLPLDRGRGEAPEGFRAELNAQREADRVTVNQFAPPGVLVNAELQILQFRGPTSAYLEPPTGKASFDVLKMAREGLMLPLRSAINKAKKENKAARKENVRFNQNGQTRTVNLEVIPLKNLRERCFLILFEDAEKAARAVTDAPSPEQPSSATRTPRRASKKEESRRVAYLESEVSETRDYLQSIQEQHEAANEELQAANEEVQSANEELQSINEELETSKEELESANEELTTVNEEMATRNTELNRLNSDLVNLQTSTKLAILLFGRDLTIRRFSAQAEKQFNLLVTDVGRPIGNVRHNLVLPDLEDLIAEVIVSVRERECEVQDKDGRWYSLRVRPYLTLDNKVDGAVLVLVDISERKQDEEALRESEERYRLIVEGATGFALVMLDLEGRVATWNLGAERLLGYAETEILGQSFSRFFREEDRAKGLPQRELETAARNEIGPDDNWLMRKDGFVFWATGATSALRDKAENLRGFTKVVRDVTERKQAEDALRQSEIRFRQLADAMPQIVWTARPDGYIDYYNERWYEFTGFPRDEFGQPSWEPILHPDDVQRCLDTYFGCIREGKPYQIEYRFKDRVRGRYRWFMGRALPIKNEQGEILRWFGTCTDIDDVKSVEEERERLLAREQQARREADEANRIKDEFLATVSHELRTPLNAIMGWAHMLDRGSLDEETAARGVKVIERNARAQNQLIADLLDVSRIISGKLRFEADAVDLIPVIEAAMENVGPAAEAKGIELRTVLNPRAGLVSGDAARLQQVVWNLLANAIKYTPKGGRVETRLQREDTHVTIIVHDTGEGISPEFLPYIFDRFRQVDGTTTRQHGGLGLGLSIVRHLVEGHGGTIRAGSKGLGKGATFTVTFPLIAVSRDESVADRPAAAKASADHASPAILKGLQVLVIDDEADARELLTIALTQSGAEVRVAGTVSGALDILDQWKPDVLVSDIGMPGEDGYELIRSVRARETERGGAIPALALTGYASPDDTARALAAGYELHVAKPVSPSELVAAVASLVMKARQV